MIRYTMLATAALALAAPLHAQSSDTEDAPKRTRIGLGAQLAPDFPGASSSSVRPLFDFNRTRGDEQFPFASADDSFGPTLFRSDSFSFGPSLALQGKRKRSDTAGLLAKVGTTVEVGGFAQADFDSFRLRAEVRKGIGGHKGVVANLAADYVVRDADNWLFAVGPRARLVNGRYNRAYFGITAAEGAAVFAPAYRPDGGVGSVGAAANALYSFTPRWGLLGYVRYDRLIGDAGKSPVVRAFGDRDQWSGGAAITYTF